MTAPNQIRLLQKRIKALAQELHTSVTQIIWIIDDDEESPTYGLDMAHVVFEFLPGSVLTEAEAASEELQEQFEDVLRGLDIEESEDGTVITDIADDHARRLEERRRKAAEMFREWDEGA